MKDLFDRFQGMEREHMSTLSRRYHVEVPAPAGSFPVERAAVYAGMESRPADPENLFRLALAFERRAVAYFQERMGATPGGSPERRLYQELAAEEQEHVACSPPSRRGGRRGSAGCCSGRLAGRLSAG